MHHSPSIIGQLQVAVIGTSGHASAELLKLLAEHPRVRITALVTGSDAHVGKNMFSLPCERLEPAEIADRCDIAIAATPTEASLHYVPGILAEGKKCIDMSGAYRLPDPALFKQHYGLDHTDPDNLKHAVYGLPELFRQKIRQAMLVANPGCYPTAVGLAVAPALEQGIVDMQVPVIVRATSGYSGAGVHYRPTGGTRPYKIARHQHAPEMAQLMNDYVLQSGTQLSPVQVSFAPRINDDQERGIDADVSLLLNGEYDERVLQDMYQSYYHEEPFVSVVDREPLLRDVVNGNGAQVAVWKEGSLLHVISVIDNLRKGAASQAIQNLNLLCGFEETTGLPHMRVSSRGR